MCLNYNIDFLPVDIHFMDSDGYIKTYLYGDSVHPNNIGCSVIGRSVKNFIYKKQQTRPIQNSPTVITENRRSDEKNNTVTTSGQEANMSQPVREIQTQATHSDGVRDSPHDLHAKGTGHCTSQAVPMGTTPIPVA